MKSLKLYALSDVGMVREKNEDSCWTGRFRDAAVLLVADGMGGAVGGQIASSTAVEVISAAFKRELGKRKVGEIISIGMERAHAAIRRKGETAGGNLNMGTTCTLAVITGEKNSVGSGQWVAGSEVKKKKIKVTFGHIGDSKLYHVRGDLVVQKSTDHTMLQRMLDAGALKPEEAENFGHKNIIYKSLGGAEKVELDPVQDFELDPGDALLLCSDGLSNYVKREEMASILRGTPSLKAAARYLVNLAKHRGGDDNITVVLAEYGAFARERSLKLTHVPKTTRAQGGSSGRRLAVFSLLAVLLILCALLFYMLRSGTRPEVIKKAGKKTVTEKVVATEVKAVKPIADGAASGPETSKVVAEGEKQ